MMFREQNCREVLLNTVCKVELNVGWKLEHLRSPLSRYIIIISLGFSLNGTEQRLTMHNATKPNKIKMNR